MRHRHVSISDSESEYSESDVSMMEAPRYRRRSVSRTRHNPSYSTTYLTPVMQDVRVHRSASTGRHQYREREKDQYRERVQPTAVIVDIKNESANKSVDRSGNKTRKTRQREENTYIDPYESEDETVLRRPRRSNRVQASASVSRDASPRPPARDYDLVIDQRMLEKNDQRQDLELLRQQQEIERLERQLARHREDNEFRILKEEEDRYEDDISDRLRRLQRYEEKERADEEQPDEEKRRAEHRLKLQKLERAEREAAEKDEVRQKLHQEKLQELQRKIEEEEKREKIKKEIRDEEIRKKLEDQERLEKEKAMKAAAVEEWKLAEQKRILKELEEKAKKEKEFKDRLRIDLGYTEEEIEAIINKKHGKDKEKEKKDKDDENKEEDHKATWIKVRRIPNYWTVVFKYVFVLTTTRIQVHRKHLLPDTLIAYQLPWAWDERDGNYIIIKTWVSEDLQEELFAHTRRLREGKLITQTSSTLTELKVNDRKKDKMYIVRKKSPSRRAWIFT
ncbi:hypothetical protein P175DRAFT_0443631 [Aspergillus ochraceoroseus IBT 24754]|uniref:Uncharacterized protein n=1 Tax=Aspergillus ochraceoroseus IBT 24754 TaxID=1392256 RepID=A0A2T5LPZ6_9EURO|nr:uncharacterized protein P175DRAFT_0443631 [Aspergillus ochraceoroseus IBT 24754]PTU18346.1 hypothetical protein P175DRAFT_0443631 [Aspergillus ochraceoroseus IBT 24754]